MEPNEQTELTRKMGTDSQIESRTPATGRWKLGGGGIEQTGKTGKGTHGHGQQCGDCWGAGNGKNKIKIKF